MFWTQEYIKYFTSIKNVQLLPNLCGYITDRYHPVRPEILVAPARGVNHIIAEQLFAAVHDFTSLSKAHAITGSKHNQQISVQSKHERIHNDKITNGTFEVRVAHIRELYPHFEYSDIAKHPAIIILPYQVQYLKFV